MIFGPTQQCCSIADDLIVFGYSEEDHDRVLFVVLDTAKHVGLHFNPDKCIFQCTQIPFFGMIVRRENTKSDPKQKLRHYKSYHCQTMCVECNHS